MSTTLTPGETRVLTILRSGLHHSSFAIAGAAGYSPGFTKRALMMLRACKLATYSARGGWVGVAS